MINRKKISRLMVIFSVAFILSIIIHPKPLCSFTHRSGWDCSSFYPFLWVNEMKFKGELGLDVSSLRIYVGQEAGFDLLVGFLIAVLTTLLFTIIYDSFILRKFGRNKLIFLLTFIGVWIILRTIISYPYSLFNLNSDWRKNSLYFRPIFGGYE